MIKDAEDFMLDYDQEYFAGPVYGEFAYTHEQVKKIMTDFAKAHVQQALEKVLTVEDASGFAAYGSYKYDILNCYPPEQIK